MSATAVETVAESTDLATLTFHDGLFGFPECRTFSLDSTTSDGVYWLQSVVHEALGFVLIDPFVFCPDYTVELSELDIARLQPAGASDIAIFVIVTLGATADAPCSLNLQGPIAFNVRSGVARQIIQPDQPTRLLRQLPLD